MLLNRRLAFESLTGYKRRGAMYQNCRFLQGPDTDPEMIDKIHNALQERQEIQITLKNYRKDGSWFWNQLDIRTSF